ncbi:permease prefix domain 1-containing protein [Amycolatopsis pittospori]|uniref:permease prefix domain 1-containing protein n=1 Tax=Amycolatopsis pittospori TaxID=2749434 RepID=UPI0015F05357|nr:permease prefix domain 1-containing protein [Amycolatopsis pittospori]
MTVIEAYLGDLRARLDGPASAKRDLLREARDGLNDAADAYREGGWSEHEAQRRAVDDFGPVHLIAQGYQAELGMHSGTRTLWKLVLGVPLMQLAWEFARKWTFGDWSQLAPAPGWYKYVAQFTHGSVFIVPVLGLFALVCMRWLSRRMDGVRLVRTVGVLIGEAVGLNLLSVALLVFATGFLDASRLFLSVPCGILMVLWVVVSVRLALLARRSWRSCATIVA